MLKVNIHDAKTNFSKYLRKVARGQIVVVCKRNVPVAEIRPIPVEKATPARLIGQYKGKIHIPDSFFDPLRPEELDYFEGKK